MTSQTLAEGAHLYPLRTAYIFDQLGLAPAGTAGIGSMSGNWTAANPPYGAVFTYSVAGSFAPDEKLVLAISDDGGRSVRKLDLDNTSGLRRIAWNLRADPTPGAASQGRGGFAGRGGRGGVPQGPVVGPGRYHAQIERVSGGKSTPVGQPQAFSVLPIAMK
jgi:hypothetical protein